MYKKQEKRKKMNGKIVELIKKCWMNFTVLNVNDLEISKDIMSID